MSLGVGIMFILVILYTAPLAITTTLSKYKYRTSSDGLCRLGILRSSDITVVETVMDRLGDPWRVRKHEEPRMCGGREGPFATFAYNTATTLSPILGFGGAFTQAASLNFHALSSTGQDAALELLFGKTGLGYNLGRTHINSCDFSTASFDFDGIDGDFDLEDFGGVKERDGGEGREKPGRVFTGSLTLTFLSRKVTVGPRRVTQTI